MAQSSKPVLSGFSADTEILTRRGWLTFDHLADGDEVATQSVDGRFEWQLPGWTAWRPYMGQMVQFHGRSLDVLVVPSHRMLWSPDFYGLAGRRTDEAASLALHTKRLQARKYLGTLPVTSIWDAPTLPVRAFEGIRRSKMGPKPRDVVMRGDHFAAFMGMYIAEGHSERVWNDWRIRIAQSVNGKGYAEYRTLLTDIEGRVPCYTGHQWTLHSRALYEYLAPLGDARTKRIPREVLDLSEKQLRIFWRYYALGDGSYEYNRKKDSGNETASTASVLLADQLQEVIQKIGYSSSVRRVVTPSTSLVRSSNVVYKLRVRKVAWLQFYALTASYSGMIGGVSTPNDMVYVRRNGHPAWAGSA